VYLTGSAAMMPRWRQRWFQWRLRTDGRRAPAEDLTLLLDGDWRERLTAVWLIAAGRRADLRPVIERGLLGDEPCGVRWSYLPALACLGTEDDAKILVAYLERALTLPPDSQCQAGALDTLIYLDEQLGTEHAEQFLGPDGLWERWTESLAGSFDWEGDLDSIRADVVFAAGRDPGVRRPALREDLVAPSWGRWTNARARRRRDRPE
jgi:uncharacterized protein DUF6000